MSEQARSLPGLAVHKEIVVTSGAMPTTIPSTKPISPWYHVKQSGGLTPLEMGVNFGLVGASCVAAQGTVHWTRTAMVQQQLAGMRGEPPLGMLAQTGSIWRSEGIRGLYRGFSAAALREATYSSLRFGLYEPLKVALDSSGGTKELPVWKKVTAGLVAGAGAAAIASPTDLLMIQMASSKQFPPPTMYQVATEVIARDGVKGLYRGLGTTVTRAAVLGATKMATYDVIKTELRRAGWTEGPGLVFTASVATGLAITVTTSPATNMQTLIMSGNVGGGGGMVNAAAEILRRQGPVGFFRGFGMQWARFGPYAVVQFAVWESLRNACGIGAI
jgi:solute carrier family 25 protein 14/30